jgi:uncharacterized membrane protein YvbJ
MALINCPECTKQISDQALHCPQCGNPIAARHAGISQEAAITTQQTAKTHKLHMMIGAVIVALGFVAIIGNSPLIGTSLFILGVGWYFAARFGAWWHNG